MDMLDLKKNMYVETVELPLDWLETAPRWMSQNLINEKWILVKVMTWGRQTTSHYMS